MTQTRPNLGFTVLAVVQATLISTIALITGAHTACEIVAGGEPSPAPA